MFFHLSILRPWEGFKMKLSIKESEELVQAIIKTAEDVGLKIRKKPQKKKTANSSS